MGGAREAGVTVTRLERDCQKLGMVGDRAAAQRSPAGLQTLWVLECPQPVFPPSPRPAAALRSRDGEPLSVLLILKVAHVQR